MKRKPTRRFGLIDVMILLAASAVGLAWGRADLLATVQVRELPTGLVFRDDQIKELPTGLVFRDHQVMRSVQFADRLIN